VGRESQRGSKVGKQVFAIPNATQCPVVALFPPHPSPNTSKLVWAQPCRAVSGERPACGVRNRLPPGRMHTKRGFCGREDLTPRKACPVAGCQAAALPSQIREPERGEAGSGSELFLCFLGGSFVCRQI